MDNLIWLPRAKYVVIVDIVLVLISAAMVAVAVFLLGTERGISLYNDYVNTWLIVPAVNSRVQEWVIFAIVPVAAVAMCIQIWADVKLMSATKMEHEPEEALRNARFWMIVTSVLLVVSGVGYISTFSIFPFVITVTCRGASLHVVSYFMEELKEVINPQSQEDTNFTPDLDV